MASTKNNPKKSLLPNFYLRAFAMGALKPHINTILPHFNRPGGKFVEIGARDGLKDSSTLYLEKALGWSGILIEPWPHLYQQCRKQRKASLCLNVAVVDSSLQDSYIEVIGKPPEASVRRKLAQESRERIHGRPIEAPVPGKKATKKVNYITTNSLVRILDRMDFQNSFDLLVLNLLGYENKALEGMDFNRYKPTFVMIRTNENTRDLPNLPHYYERVTSSKHDDITYMHLFRYADFGSN